MTQACVIINGKVMLAGQLDHWTQKPPEFIHELADRVKGRTKPYLKYCGGALAEAVAQNQDVTIEVTTRPDGWNMNVMYGVAQLSA